MPWVKDEDGDLWNPETGEVCWFPTWTIYRIRSKICPSTDRIIGSTARVEREYCYHRPEVAAKIASTISAREEEWGGEDRFVIVRSGGSPFCGRDIWFALAKDLSECPF